MIEVSPTDAAWIAGFFDGEGCITVNLRQSSAPQLKISISQKFPRPLERIRDILGYGVIRERTVKKKFTKNSFSIEGKEKMKHFLETIRPYSCNKFSQIEVALEFLEYVSIPRGEGWRGITEHERSKREELYSELRRLKTLG